MNRVMAAYNDSIIAKSLNLLPKHDKHKIAAIVVAQILLSVVDLLAIGFVGVLGALSIRGIQSKAPGNRVSWVLNQLFIDDFSFQKQVLFLGLVAASLLLIKTAISVVLSKKIIKYLR